MIYLVYFLLLLPAFTFGVLPDISTMPWVLVFLPYFSLYIHREVFNAFLLLAIFGIFSIIIWNPELDLVLQSSLALLNATIIFPYLLKINKKKYDKLIKVFIVYALLTVFIGILQYSFDSIRDLTHVIFGRASGLHGGKGAPGLSTEPSRSAIDLFLIVVTLIFINKNQYKKRVRLIIIISILYLILLNRSNTAYLYIFIYFFIFFIKNIGIKNAFKICALFTIILFMVLYVNNNMYEIHAVSSIKSILQSNDKYYLLHMLAGHRLVGLLVSINSFSLFGHGLGSWYNIVFEYLNNNYYYIKDIGFYRVNGLEPTPPMTFVGRYIMEIGVLGIIIYSYFLFKKRTLKNLVKLLKDTEPLFVLITLFVLSYGGSPIPFICLGVMYAHKFKFSREI